MQIVLLILKIITIILVILLGLLLALVLTILFVPFRYQLKASRILAPKEKLLGEMEGSKQEESTLLDEISVLIKASWLFPCCYGMFSFQQKKVTYWFKIFGYSLIHSEKKSKANQKSGSEESITKERKRAKQKSKQGTKEAGSNIPKQLEDKREEEIQNVIQDEVQDKKEDRIEEPSQVLENIEAQQERTRNAKRRSSFLDKMKAIKAKITQTFQNIHKSFQNIGSKINKIREFIHDEENKVGFSILWKYLKQVLLHLKPQKVRGEIHFGTGDPCTTGKVLGVLGILYTYYGKSFTMIPDFEEAVIEGKIEVKGRIRLAALLIIAIKLVLNKECKRLWHHIQNLKEEL